MDRNDYTDTSLTREKQNSAQLPGKAAPSDGKFDSYPDISSQTKQNLMKKGFTGLFPIQQHCFYPIYNREDVIARDLTGSGKTLAFALPVVEYLRKQQLLGSRRV